MPPTEVGAGTVPCKETGKEDTPTALCPIYSEGGQCLKWTNGVFPFTHDKKALKALKKERLEKKAADTESALPDQQKHREHVLATSTVPIRRSRDAETRGQVVAASASESLAVDVKKQKSVKTKNRKNRRNNDDNGTISNTSNKDAPSDHTNQDHSYQKSFIVPLGRQFLISMSNPHAAAALSSTIYEPNQKKATHLHNTNWKRNSAIPASCLAVEQRCMQEKVKALEMASLQSFRRESSSSRGASTKRDVDLTCTVEAQVLIKHEIVVDYIKAIEKSTGSSICYTMVRYSVCQINGCTHKHETKLRNKVYALMNDYIKTQHLNYDINRRKFNPEKKAESASRPKSSWTKPSSVIQPISEETIIEGHWDTFSKEQTTIWSKNRAPPNSTDMLPIRKRCKPFHRFGQLPAELREIIWKCAVNDVEMDALVEHQWNSEINGSPQGSRLERVSVNNPLLHVCRQSRFLALKNHEVTFGNVFHGPKITFDYARERLFLLSRTAPNLNFMAKHLFVEEDRSRVTLMMIPLRCYIQDKDATCRALTMFRNLKTLWIAVGNGRDDGIFCRDDGLASKIKYHLGLHWEYHFKVNKGMKEEKIPKVPGVVVNVLPEKVAMGLGIDGCMWAR